MDDGGRAVFKRVDLMEEFFENVHGQTDLNSRYLRRCVMPQHGGAGVEWPMSSP